MNERKKKPNLWDNIRKRRAKGLPRKKPGQPGYPKTLDVGEAVLRSVIRREIMKEYTLGQALMSGSGQFFDAIVSLFKDAFGPTEEERLKRSGDDRVIDEYQRFLGTLHMTPEYKAIWENYKQAQRSHASMDSDFDRARDPQHSVGRAFNKLKSRVLGKFDELERTLSPENRDIWQPSVDDSRATFRKIFDDWEMRKITTGRVLSLLDSRGINEGRIREAGEMFAGKDLEQMQTTKLVTALEAALMDLEDVGCPDDSDARVITDQVIDTIEKMRDRSDYDTSMLPPVVSRAIYAIRTCRHIPPREAEHIANQVATALDSSQVIDRF